VAILETRVVGDDRKLPLAEREEWRAIKEADDPVQAIRAFARTSRIVASRVAGPWDILLDASRSDPELRRIHELSQEQRHIDMSRMPERLVQLGALRQGLTPARAADTVWALAGPDLYIQLVLNRGWTTDEYETWLGDILEAVLLEPGHPPVDGTDRRSPRV
jgi:hypothetical protein